MRGMLFFSILSSILFAPLVPPVARAEEAPQPPEATVSSPVATEPADPVREPDARIDYWTGRVGLGALGDSNPSLLAEGFELSVPDERKFVGGERDQAATTDLSFALYPLARRDENRIWHLGLSFDGRQTAYRDLDRFDLGEFRAGLHLARGSSPTGYLRGPQGSVRVPIGLSRRTLLIQASEGETTLDGSNYFRLAWGSASLGLRLRSSYALQFDLEASHRQFDVEPAVGRRSGTDLQASLVQTFYLRREDRTLRITAFGGHRDSGPAFSKGFLRGQMELSFPFGRRWDLLASATYQDDRYLDPQSDLFFARFDPFDPEFDPTVKSDLPIKRHDQSLRLALAVAWSWRPRLALIGRLSTFDHDTNLFLGREQPLDYRRTLSSLGVAWTF